MVNPQGTSFIPQRPTRGKPQQRRVRKVYVLAYLSYVMFFGSLIAAGLVFFFSFSLDVQLESQREVLDQERQKFNQGDIESVRDLERRIKIAEERLNNHVSVLAVFEALERSAVQSLTYSSFNYERLNDSFPRITFTGTSDRFNNVLFQREVLRSNPILAGSTFTEVLLQTQKNAANPTRNDETITFTLQKEVDTSLIGYTPRLNTQDDAAAQSAQVAPEEEVPVTFSESTEEAAQSQLESQ